MKIGIYQYIRRSAIIASLAIYMFSNSSCCMICSCCPPRSGTLNEKQAKDHQEMLAARQHAQSTQMGLIMSFNEESNNNIQTAVSNTTEAAWTDLSFRYVRSEGTCPLSGKGRHTYATVGPNINFKSSGSDVYGDGSHQPGIGFQAGFQTVNRYSEKFSVVPGLIFKQNNAKEATEITEGGEPPYNTSYKIEDKYTYNYLSIPILAQYNLTQSLTISAGPELNYLLNARVNSTTTMPGQGGHSEKTDITKASVRAGLDMEAAVKYDIPGSRWGVELLYDHRLSRLNKKHPEGYPNYTLPAWRMKSLQLSAKCRICDLGKGRKHLQ